MYFGNFLLNKIFFWMRFSFIFCITFWSSVVNLNNKSLNKKIVVLLFWLYMINMKNWKKRLIYLAKVPFLLQWSPCIKTAADVQQNCFSIQSSNLLITPLFIINRVCNPGWQLIIIVVDTLSLCIRWSLELIAIFDSFRNPKS